jgi:hypothetical protein
MYAACALIGPGLLRRLYLEELRSTDDIACRVGCSATTVRRHLRRFNIPLRSRGPCVKRRAATRTDVTQRGWCVETAYVVGLIATDGNLERRKPVITIVSRDITLLDTVRHCLRLRTLIRRHGDDGGRSYHRLSWYDRSLYQWLRQVGLTPAKSLTLSPLHIPDEYFADFFRGCIDGDGSILVYTDRYHADTCDRYIYERLYLSIVSASYAFIDWLQATVYRLTHAEGSMTVRTRAGAHSAWTLRYSKTESIRLLNWMYYAPDLPCLERKRATAEKFLAPLGHAANRRAGRPRVGWIYNGTDQDT